MRASTRMQARRGFTLPELLVAIVLIDLGLLSIVAMSAVVVREADEGRARAAAARAALNRLEAIQSVACAAGAGTAAGPHGIRERWTATVSDSATLEIADTGSFRTASGVNEIVMRTRSPC